VYRSERLDHLVLRPLVVQDERWRERNEATRAGRQGARTGEPVAAPAAAAPAAAAPAAEAPAAEQPAETSEATGAQPAEGENDSESE